MDPFIWDSYRQVIYRFDIFDITWIPGRQTSLWTSAFLLASGPEATKNNASAGLATGVWWCLIAAYLEMHLSRCNTAQISVVIEKTKEIEWICLPILWRKVEKHVNTIGILTQLSRDNVQKPSETAGCNCCNRMGALRLRSLSPLEPLPPKKTGFLLGCRIFEAELL